MSNKFPMNVLARIPSAVFVRATPLGIEGRRVIVHAKFTERECEFGKLRHANGDPVELLDAVDLETARWEPDGVRVYLDGQPEVKSSSQSFRDRADLENHIGVMSMAFWIKRLADSGELPTFVG